MAKEIHIRMGANLGFIAKIVLTDGTVLDNMHVLYRAPIPTKKQFEKIFYVANEMSRTIIGIADEQWSAYPELMKDVSMYGESTIINSHL